MGRVRPIGSVADGAADLVARLAPQYWDLDDPGRTRDLEDMLADDQVRVVIHPGRVRRFSY